MVNSSQFLLVLLWAVGLFHAPVLAEYGDTNHKCKDLLQRREWYNLSSTCPHFDLLTVCARRRLNNTEKANYIKAVKCLQARPPLHPNIAAVKTRFDEFQALHIDVADRVHTTVNLGYCFHKRRWAYLFLGLFLALASTFFEPLRKRPTWRMRLRRGNSVRCNNCLKVII
jgi:hypothetical protein